MAFHKTIDWDPRTGRHREYVDFGDGSYAIKSTYDTTEFRKYMKEYQNNYEYDRFSEMRHVATIPDWMQEQLINEHYVFHYIPEDQSVRTDMKELRHFLNFDERRHQCRPATKEFI